MRSGQRQFPHQPPLQKAASTADRESIPVCREHYSVTLQSERSHFFSQSPLRKTRHDWEALRKSLDHGDRKFQNPS